MRGRERGILAVAAGGMLLLLSSSRRSRALVPVGKSRGNVKDGIAWGNRASPELLAAVKETARRFGVEPGWLLTSFYNESHLMPWSHLNQIRVGTDARGKPIYKYQGYGTPDHIDDTTIGGGLFGYMKGEMAKKGLTISEWLSLSDVDQLAWWEKIYHGWEGKLHSLDDIRLLGWGKTDLIGRDEDTVAFRRGDGAYEANSTLDSSGSGVITKYDLVKHARALYDEGMR